MFLFVLLQWKSFYFNHTENHFVCRIFFSPSCFQCARQLFNFTKFELSPKSIYLHDDFRLLFFLGFVRHTIFSGLLFCIFFFIHLFQLNHISHRIRSNKVIIHKGYFFSCLNALTRMKNCWMHCSALLICTLSHFFFSFFRPIGWVAAVCWL